MTFINFLLKVYLWTNKINNLKLKSPLSPNLFQLSKFPIVAVPYINRNSIGIWTRLINKQP